MPSIPFDYNVLKKKIYITSYIEVCEIFASNMSFNVMLYWLNEREW